ncbi:DUF2585 family protein [Candidatus Kaiserbacteria bacterium]|nr:DUF2585 family protein [Candidatus Kaiserbacteria bacterium]
MITSSWRYFWPLGCVLIVIQAAVLYLFGQPAICTCGYVKLWEGVITSSGMSQHLSDWYSFSHIIHGFLFFLFTWAIFPRWSLQQRLLLAMSLEIGWEIAENTPMVIEAYRQQALARGYVGDSIINSIMDTLMMTLGFVLAWRFSVWTVIFLALAMEIGVAYFIHDNLTLNIIGFIHHFPAIDAWQAEIMQI